MNIKNLKLYLVEWQDSHSDSGWLTKEQLEKFINREKCIVENIGYLIHETKDEICIASRRMKWAEDGDPQWGMVQKIPKTWIRKIKLLKEGRK